MGKLLLERLFTLFLKLFGMAVILFVVTQVLPADPAAVAAGTNARPEQIEKIRAGPGLGSALPRAVHDLHRRFAAR